MIPQWKMSGKDNTLTVKSLGGIGNGRYDVKIMPIKKPVEEGEGWKE